MQDMTITAVKARQIFDSRANPTVEVEVTLACGAVGRGMVPSGASTGAFEALELRDTDRPEVLGGKGVRTAIRNVEEILAPFLIGRQADRQTELDRGMIALDGTPNKSRLGANAILGCSMAVAYAAAAAKGEPLYRYLGGVQARILPVPMIQIIGGGAHAAGAIDIQDFLVIPMSAPSFEQGFAMVVDVYNATKKVFRKYGKPLAIADEGGFWPTDFKSNEEGLALLLEGIELAGYRPMEDIAIALDIASSEFYDEASEEYVFALENKRMSREEFVDLLCSWVDKYPIISIEDGCSELDWKGHALLTEKLGGRIQLIGDDLFTTNLARIKKGWELGCDNAVLIKLNQIGSVSETLEAIKMAHKAGYTAVTSHRSGETEDTTIADLAVALNTCQIKTGAPSRTERVAKYNQLLRIEDELGDAAVYPQMGAFNVKR